MIRTLIISCAAIVAGCASVSAGHHEEKSHHSDSDHHEMMKEHGPHLISVASAQSFEATLEAATAGIEARGFKTFAIIDHAAGAASIDQELRPTTLIIFGNPKGGTPLMQAEQRMGLQLPLKMLIYVNDKGATEIAYPDMAHTFHEYGISELSMPLEKISGALAAIAAEAAAGK